jgi:hypothetical protein
VGQFSVSGNNKAFESIKTGLKEAIAHAQGSDVAIEPASGDVVAELDLTDAEKFNVIKSLQTDNS